MVIEVRLAPTALCYLLLPLFALAGYGSCRQRCFAFRLQAPAAACSPPACKHPPLPALPARSEAPASPPAGAERIAVEDGSHRRRGGDRHRRHLRQDVDAVQRALAGVHAGCLQRAGAPRLLPLGSFPRRAYGGARENRTAPPAEQRTAPQAGVLVLGRECRYHPCWRGPTVPPVHLHVKLGLGRQGWDAKAGPNLVRRRRCTTTSGSGPSTSRRRLSWSISLTSSSVIDGRVNYVVRDAAHT